VIASSREDALQRTGVLPFMVQHEASFSFPLLLFVALHLRAATVAFLLRERDGKYHTAVNDQIERHLFLFPTMPHPAPRPPSARSDRPRDSEQPIA